MALSTELKDLALMVYQGLGTPLARGLETSLQTGDWDAIAQARVSPRDYTSAQAYFEDAQAAALLKKYSSLPSTLDKRGAAVANWREGESQCYRTNERLSPYLEGFSHPDWNEDVDRHIRAIREKIAKVLGKAPRLDDLEPRFGPGATFSDKSVRSTVAHKLQHHASITHGAVWFLLDWVGTAWGREALKRNVSPFPVRGNRYTTAPKDATKDRSIAAEPGINVFYQLALGRCIRRCLKRIGIDLDEGQLKHRVRACAASINGLDATLDLKNASDTLAWRLVKLLLPPDWYTLLSELRSPLTRFEKPDADRLRATDRDHVWHHLEKFSSMGNGFTFELETLIFWAIADHAVTHDGHVPEGGPTLVYGDDIICASSRVAEVTSALKFFGFTINEEKSFASGPFRESCGGDFWHGRPVRPYYQKEPLDEPQQLIAAANQVRRVALDLFAGLGGFATAWHALQGRLPFRVRRCRGPSWLGDAVIHDDEVNYSWTSSRMDRLWGYVPVNYRKIALREFDPGTVFACGLYGVRVSEGFINPRDAVAGYDIRRIPAYGVDWVPPTHTAHWNIPEPTQTRPITGPNYDNVVVWRSRQRGQTLH